MNGKRATISNANIPEKGAVGHKEEYLQFFSDHMARLEGNPSQEPYLLTLGPGDRNCSNCTANLCFVILKEHHDGW